MQAHSSKTSARPLIRCDILVCNIACLLARERERERDSDLRFVFVNNSTRSARISCDTNILSIVGILVDNVDFLIVVSDAKSVHVRMRTSAWIYINFIYANLIREEKNVCVLTVYKPSGTVVYKWLQQLDQRSSRPEEGEVRERMTCPLCQSSTPVGIYRRIPSSNTGILIKAHHTRKHAMCVW